MILAQPEFTSRVDAAVKPAYQPEYMKPDAAMPLASETAGPSFEDHLAAAKDYTEKQNEKQLASQTSSNNNPVDTSTQNTIQAAANDTDTPVAVPKKVKKNSDENAEARQLPKKGKDTTEKQIDAHSSSILKSKVQNENSGAHENQLRLKKKQNPSELINTLTKKNKTIVPDNSNETSQVQLHNAESDVNELDAETKNLKNDVRNQDTDAVIANPQNHPTWLENVSNQAVSEKAVESVESKKNSKTGKNDLTIEVKDLRSAPQSSDPSDSKTVQRLDEARHADGAGQNQSDFESHMSEQSAVNQNAKTAENTAELEFGKGRAGEMSAKDMARELKENKNADIARTAKIMLKNDGVGEIRLILKPEKLGSVRIKLEMKENVLAGRIIVDNIQVKEIFEDNLKSLQQALQDQGFDTSGLEVSVGGRQGQPEGRPDQEMSDQQRQAAVEELANSVPSAGDAFGQGSYDGGINIVA